MARDLWGMFDFDYEAARLGRENASKMFELLFGPRPTREAVLHSEAWHNRAAHERVLWFGTNLVGDRRGLGR